MHPNEFKRMVDVRGAAEHVGLKVSTLQSRRRDADMSDGAGADS